MAREASSYRAARRNKARAEGGLGVWRQAWRGTSPGEFVRRGRWQHRRETIQHRSGSGLYQRLMLGLSVAMPSSLRRAVNG